jgi:hypothetical protein
MVPKGFTQFEMKRSDATYRMAKVIIRKGLNIEARKVYTR